jgi:hypothetical protein
MSIEGSLVVSQFAAGGIETRIRQAVRVPQTT